MVVILSKDETYQSDDLIPEAFREKQIEEVRNINSYGIRISGYVDYRLFRHFEQSSKYPIEENTIGTFDLILKPCETWTATFNYLIILSLLRYNIVTGLFKNIPTSISVEENRLLVNNIISLQDFCNNRFNNLIKENCNIEERNPDFDEYWDWETRREAYSNSTTYERKKEIFAGLKVCPKYHKAMDPTETLDYLINTFNLIELGKINNNINGLFQLNFSLDTTYIEITESHTKLSNKLFGPSYLDKFKNKWENFFPMLNLWYYDMYFNRFEVTPNNLSPEYFNLGKDNNSLFYFLKILESNGEQILPRFDHLFK